jgi:hypothetical protein
MYWQVLQPVVICPGINNRAYHLSKMFLCTGWRYNLITLNTLAAPFFEIVT